MTTLRVHAACSPERLAVSDGVRALSFAELVATTDLLADQFSAHGVRVLGILADNGIPWVCTDLAADAADLVLVPLPLFFSPSQLRHAIATSGIDALLTDRPEQLLALLADGDMKVTQQSQLPGLANMSLLQLVSGDRVPGVLPPETAKVTFTSGTTGTPKGVCLGRRQMRAVAQALLDATQATSIDRHLCLTPLSTLLENIGGVLVPLLAGASTHVWPLARVGLTGASGLDAVLMVQALQQAQASSAIMVPQMLQGLLHVVGRGTPVPEALRFIAVGGAPVATRLLHQAALHGIPVFEGYGLSECASVVALNTPGQTRPGSVGRPLPHVQLQFGADQEILVSGSEFLGYLGEKRPQQPWPTGDLGYLDADGYLHLLGRKKSVFITSFGRNVAPEWVERELTAHPAILQAAVFGESRPFNTAVITVAPHASHAAVQHAVDAANQLLPDYARIRHWLPASVPFSLRNEQLTSNGRPRRAAILAAYAPQIQSIHEEEADVVL
jgi:long-chain acyl-CoA synthetase